MFERARHRGLAALALTCLAACGAIIGLDDFAIVAPSPEAGLSEAAVADAAVPDDVAAVSPRAQDDGGGCIVPLLTDAGAIATHETITVDGDVGDWPCSAFSVVNAASAERGFGTPLSYAQYAVAWSANGLFFACHVFDANVEGTSPLPFANDACELMLGVSPPTPDGLFRANDLHLIVDHRNVASVYSGSGAGISLPPGLMTAASAIAGGFIVEAFIPASVLGLTPSANMKLIFDVQIDDNQGDAASLAGALYAYAEPAVGSGDCSEAGGPLAPFCDSQLWGPLTLAP